ncbi:MAG: uracil-DNA glycosylase [Candidatus Omnitrophica bacterium]|nr:uracil-DNA glycosylase [Candidatus Omnitrophota bacterium]
MNKNCRWYDACPLKRYYQQGKLDKKWVEEYCWVDNPDCVRKKLEEKGIYHADNMLPDGTFDERLK